MLFDVPEFEASGHKGLLQTSDILEFEATGDQGRRLVPTPSDVAGFEAIASGV